MTPLVLIVGFLGSGKTTFLKNLLPALKERGVLGSVVINDYQNAKVDAEQLAPLSEEIRAITGDCVCCGSREELVGELEKFQHGERRVMLVETNGTTDSEQLIEMLSLEPGLTKFSLPIQVSLIDAKRWQKRFWHNALEREQARTASHVAVSRLDEVTPKRLAEVEKSLAEYHVAGRRVDVAGFADELVKLSAELAGEAGRHFHSQECGCGHEHEGPEHHHEHEHHHFASLQIGLPEQVSREAFDRFLRGLPETVIRAKGMVRFIEQPGEYFVFQKVDRFDEPQFFPVGTDPKVKTPLALFIGPELSESALREAVGTL